MSEVDEILKRVKRLSAAEKRELLKRLNTAPKHRRARVSAATKRARAQAKRGGPYAKTLALAGMFRSGHSDVSENVDEHYADIVLGNQTDPEGDEP